MTPTLLPGQVLSGRENDPEARSVFRGVESQHLHRLDHIEPLAVPTEVRRPAATGPKFAGCRVEKPHLLRPPLAAPSERVDNSLMQVKRGSPGRGLSGRNTSL